MCIYIYLYNYDCANSGTSVRFGNFGSILGYFGYSETGTKLGPETNCFGKFGSVSRIRFFVPRLPAGAALPSPFRTIPLSGLQSTLSHGLRPICLPSSLHKRQEGTQSLLPPSLSAFFLNDYSSLNLLSELFQLLMLIQIAKSALLHVDLLLYVPVDVPVDA
jgi:hypothetical protein